MTNWNRIRVVPLVFASIVAGSLVNTTGAAVVQDEETLEWLDDYDEALALAKETGKPLFVEFRCAP